MLNHNINFSQQSYITDKEIKAKRSQQEFIYNNFIM